MPQTVTFTVLDPNDISHFLTAGIDINATHQIQGGAIFWCDTTSGSFTITLPDAQIYKNRQIIINKITAANTLTVDTLLSQTINEASTQTLTVQFDSISVVSDGNNWGIV